MSSSKYLGHEALISYLHEQDKDNYSYYKFLKHHSDIIINPALSNYWRELDNTWAERFLEEAEKLIDKKGFTDLTEKKLKAHRGHGFTVNVLFQYWCLRLVLGRITGYDLLVTTPSPLFRRPNFVDKSLLVKSERSRREYDLKKFWKKKIKKQKRKLIEIKEEKESIIPTSKPRKKRNKQKHTYKTELEVLSTIPPPIYYPDLDEYTNTKSTMARKPFSVKSWTSFIDEVQSCELDDKIKQYSRPSFKTYRSYDISNEEDVREALKNIIFDNLHMITTSQQQIEFYKRISMEDNIKGDPDFIYRNNDELLTIIEVKTRWDLCLEDGESLHEKYKEDLRRKECETVSPNPERNFSVVDIIYQMFGYLVVNKLQYGILTTYNQNWFFRRPKEELRALEISPTSIYEYLIVGER
ncbi:13885_t:CDS:2 [Cetraspora pellucida]|uniref:13885_t:CDS:1 n=1 Tax=Cetraspora pellucida TaxID=1433469 RepID=A0ACA9LFA3_9GLOM|nr:13885_t:CDS:2 [Cetraspora pellucida]